MERAAVKSSHIKAVGYNAETKTMEVEFMNGGVYEYPGVPESEYVAMVGAESVGSYFGKKIRPAFKGRRAGEASQQVKEAVR
jgi:hypothetical protein